MAKPIISRRRRPRQVLPVVREADPARKVLDTLASDPCYVGIRLRGLAALVSDAAAEERIERAVGFFVSTELHALALALEGM